MALVGVGEGVRSLPTESTVAEAESCTTREVDAAATWFDSDSLCPDMSAGEWVAGDTEGVERVGAQDNVAAACTVVDADDSVGALDDDVPWTATTADALGSRNQHNAQTQ